MKMKLQQTGIDVENFSPLPPANSGRPERLLDGRPGSPASPCRQPAEVLSDRDHARLMEERYGIGAEGFF